MPSTMMSKDFEEATEKVNKLEEEYIENGWEYEDYYAQVWDIMEEMNKKFREISDLNVTEELPLEKPTPRNYELDYDLQDIWCSSISIN